MAYLSVDIDECLEHHHKFRTIWSDKTPEKVSLMCIDCSLKTGKNAYAAYREGILGFGEWNSRPKRVMEHAENSVAED